MKWIIVVGALTLVLVKGPQGCERIEGVHVDVGATCATPDSVCCPNFRCALQHDGKVFACECPEGFMLEGADCLDLDECLIGPCAINARCRNTHGGFVCACEAPYVLGAEGCRRNHAPNARAHAPEFVNGGSSVELDGSRSDDPDHGDTDLSFHWLQTAGIPVRAEGTDSETLRIDVPDSNQPERVEFALTVTDAHGASATVTASVTVVPFQGMNASVPGSGRRVRGLDFESQDGIAIMRCSFGRSSGIVHGTPRIRRP